MCVFYLPTGLSKILSIFSHMYDCVSVMSVSVSVCVCVCMSCVQFGPFFVCLKNRCVQIDRRQFA